MKKYFFISYLILQLFFMPFIIFADLTGIEVIEEQKNRHESNTEETMETMILVDRFGNKEQRQLSNYSKTIGSNEFRTLIAFTYPASIKGTALLTWDNNEEENDQWIYLPAQQQMRRIASSNKEGYFLGTDFTYEDLETEDMNNYEYTIINSEIYDGNDCWIIEAVPINDEVASNSGYSKRIMWIRKDIYFPQ